MPEFVGGGKLTEGEFAGDGGRAAGAVVFEKGVAVAAVGEGEIEQFGIFERLLHAGPDGVGVVFGLDHGQAEVGFVIQQIIGLAGGPALDGAAADDHPAGGEVDLFAQLGQDVPFGSVWRPDNRGGVMYLVRMSASLSWRLSMATPGAERVEERKWRVETGRMGWPFGPHPAAGGREWRAGESGAVEKSRVPKKEWRKHRGGGPPCPLQWAFLREDPHQWAATSLGSGQTPAPVPKKLAQPVGVRAAAGGPGGVVRARRGSFSRARSKPDPPYAFPSGMTRSWGADPG